MRLRTFQEEHCQVLLEILTHPEVKKTYMLPDFETKEDAIPLFRRLMDLSHNPDRFVRGIFAGEEPVGFCNDVEVQDGTIELGYVIHPDHWGKGYATAALKLAMEELFSLGYREVITGAFEENPASLRVMEKAGMTPIDKVDDIEYRGRIHKCVYRVINK